MTAEPAGQAPVFGVRHRVCGHLAAAHNTLRPAQTIARHLGAGWAVTHNATDAELLALLNNVTCQVCRVSTS